MLVPPASTALILISCPSLPISYAIIWPFSSMSSVHVYKTFSLFRKRYKIALRSFAQQSHEFILGMIPYSPWMESRERGINYLGGFTGNVEENHLSITRMKSVNIQTM